MAKKRFGISIDEDLYVKINEIAKKLGVERSRVVEDAIRSYITDLEHFIKEHRCSGLIVVESPEGEGMEIEKILANHKAVVVNYTHHHVENRCIYTIIVHGESSKLANLYSEIARVRCSSRRYIPLHRD